MFALEKREKNETCPITFYLDLTRQCDIFLILHPVAWKTLEPKRVQFHLAYSFSIWFKLKLKSYFSFILSNFFALVWWCDSWHWFHLPLPGKMSWTNSAWKNWAKPKDRQGGDLWVKMGRTRAVVPNGWRPWTWFYLLLRPAMALAMAASQWPSNYCLQSLPAVPQVTVSLFQLNFSFFSSIYLFHFNLSFQFRR